MRWLYWDPSVESEVQYRQETLAKIDAWWDEFQSNVERLEELFAGRADWDLASWMTDHLGAIDERLMWEFGPAVDGDGHRLVITPEANRYLRPLLASVLERAPTADGWEFYPYRVPCRNESDLADVLQARTGRTPNDLFVTAKVGDFGKIDLVFYSGQFHSEADHEDDMAVALIATESSLGEQVLDVWVSELHTSNGNEPGLFSRLLGGTRKVPADAFPLVELKSQVATLIEGLEDQRSELPFFKTIEDREWGTIRLQPPELDQHFGRTDLLICVSGALDLWNVAHSSFIFDSRCYSRHGESFCYLKMATPEGPTEDNGERRANIEDELTEVLVERELGCAIGGGAGISNAYVDLALMDPKRALPTIREVLNRHQIHRDCWLLFFDDHLSQEWIGVFEDAVAPGMPEE